MQFIGGLILALVVLALPLGFLALTIYVFYRIIKSAVKEAILEAAEEITVKIEQKD